MPTLAEVLRAGADAFLRARTLSALSAQQARAWRHICACRTPLLGGQQLACSHCGRSHWQYHSCRNRHCPQCGARAREAWLQGRLAEVLDLPYTHLVFTLPHALNGLYLHEPRWFIHTLFACVAQTLKLFAANPRWMGVSGGQAAFSLVLHTWSQDLSLHVHLHALMACGVLDARGYWQRPARSANFLFPVQALSRVFRGKFMAALRERQRAAQGLGAQPTDASLGREEMKALYHHDWVVYAKTPLGGAEQVLAYLGRYTHRTAIGNERIKAITGQGEVVFSVRADAHGGKRLVRLRIEEFIRRFLLHVLPAGVQRIRHYGVLANGCKRAQLALARASLGQQPPQAQAPGTPAQEAAREFMARVARIDIERCARCGIGRLRVVASLSGAARLPAPGSQALAASASASARGPPP